MRSRLQILILFCLGLAALIPRIILANQLDLITDEIIYILAGKSYIPLLKHITTSPWTCPNCWQVNYEHPPLVKLLIGLSILGNNHAGHPFNELVAARIPSIIAGTTLIMGIYWLGRKPFGQVVAFLAALSLAFSPWLVYFSSIAYLDITMTALITIAYLLTWHATRRPWLYLCVALFVSLGIDSKYTATLIIPGIVLFTAYYFFVLRLRLPTSHGRPSLPWLWWLTAVILTPLCFLVLDPVIWSHPLHLFMHSLLYEWDHAVGGHMTFLAGSYNLHVPHWTALYIIANKISAFVTVPAAIFGIIALIQLIRYHLSARKETTEAKGEETTTEERKIAKDRYLIRRGVPLDRPRGSLRWFPEGFGVNKALKAAQGHAVRRDQIPPLERGRKTPPYDSLPLRINDATTTAFLMIWLLTTLAMFSLLNIVVGTHYLLPLAPPITIAGAYTLVSLTRYSIRKISLQSASIMVGKGHRKGADGASPSSTPRLFDASQDLSTHRSVDVGLAPSQPLRSSTPRHFDAPQNMSTHRGVDDGLVPSRSSRSPVSYTHRTLKFALTRLMPFLVVGGILVGPHLVGLLNTAGAEGYTSEFFHGENKTLQVAYAGYREAVQWLDTHSQGEKRIGLGALPQTLWRGDQNVSWFAYNSNLLKRFQIQEAHPKDQSYPYDYLVWPMHLVQRGYSLPPSWHIIHIITGGDTTYCYIAVASPP